VAFATSCSNPESIMPQRLSKIEIENLLIERSEFKEYITSTISNIKSLNGLSENEIDLFIKFYHNSKRTNYDCFYDLEIIHNKLKLDISAFDNYSALKRILDHRYSYDKKDLFDVLSKHIILFLKDTSASRIMNSWDFNAVLPMVICNDTCTEISDQTYKKEDHRTSWENVWIGCYKCCMSNCGAN
jgi:hypothetical protein